MPREIIIVPYDDNWNKRFTEIKDVLKNIFSGVYLGIYHIGSTSIPGMPAKPIIDVMVTFDDINTVDRLSYRMMEANYISKGENGIADRRYFQKLAVDGINHTEHIHCFAKDNPLVKDHLLFRDYLLIDKDAFNRYRNVKLEAAKLFPFDPVKYTKFKSDCIESIMIKAKAHFDDCRLHVSIGILS